MQIQEEYGSLEQWGNQIVYQINHDGMCARKEAAVITEHVMDVYINKCLSVKLVCTPQNLTELMLGRMFSEGIIKEVSEIEHIHICDYGSRAEVVLKRYQKEQKEKRNLMPVIPLAWKTDWVWRLMELFDEEMPLHRRTNAPHCCFLMKDGQDIFQCEDIGRHNAVDKVIGYALRNRIDFSQCVLYITGRMPVDLVFKVIRAGIPILVSKEVPTKEALELAGKYRLTVIGQAKKGQMILYTGKLAQDMEQCLQS